MQLELEREGKVSSELSGPADPSGGAPGPPRPRRSDPTYLKHTAASVKRAAARGLRVPLAATDPMWRFRHPELMPYVVPDAHSSPVASATVSRDSSMLIGGGYTSHAAAAPRPSALQPPPPPPPPPPASAAPTTASARSSTIISAGDARSKAPSATARSAVQARSLSLVTDGLDSGSRAMVVPALPRSPRALALTSHDRPLATALPSGDVVLAPRVQAPRMGGQASLHASDVTDSHTIVQAFHPQFQQQLHNVRVAQQHMARHLALQQQQQQQLLRSGSGATGSPRLLGAPGSPRAILRTVESLPRYGVAEIPGVSERALHALPPTLSDSRAPPGARVAAGNSVPHPPPPPPPPSIMPRSRATAR